MQNTGPTSSSPSFDPRVEPETPPTARPTPTKQEKVNPEGSVGGKRRSVSEYSPKLANIAEETTAAASGKLPDLAPRSQRFSITKAPQALAWRFRRFVKSMGRDEVAQRHQDTARAATEEIKDKDKQRELRDKMAAFLRDQAACPNDQDALQALGERGLEIQQEIAAVLQEQETQEPTLQAEEPEEVEVQEQQVTQPKQASNFERAIKGFIRTPEQKMIHRFAKEDTQNAGRSSERRQLTDKLDKCYTEIAAYKKLEDEENGLPKGPAFATKKEFKDYLKQIKERESPTPELRDTLSNLSDIEKQVEERMSTTLPESLRSQSKEVQLEKVADKLKDTVFNQLKMQILEEKYKEAEEAHSRDLTKPTFSEMSNADFEKLYAKIAKEAEERLAHDPSVSDMLREVQDAKDPFLAGTDLLEVTNEATQSLEEQLTALQEQKSQELKEEPALQASASEQQVTQPKGDEPKIKQASNFERAMKGFIRTSEQKKMIHSFAKDDTVDAGRPSDRRPLTDQLDKCYTEIAEYKKLEDKKNGLPKGLPFANKKEFTTYLQEVKERKPGELSSTLTQLARVEKQIDERSSRTLSDTLRNQSRDVKLAAVKDKLQDAVFHKIKMEIFGKKYQELDSTKPFKQMTHAEFSRLTTRVAKEAADQLAQDPPLSESSTLKLSDMLKQVEDAEDPFLIGETLLARANVATLDALTSYAGAADSLSAHFRKPEDKAKLAAWKREASQAKAAADALKSFDVLSLMTSGTESLKASIEQDKARLEAAPEQLAVLKEQLNPLEEKLEPLEKQLKALEEQLRPLEDAKPSKETLALKEERRLLEKEKRPIQEEKDKLSLQMMELENLPFQIAAKSTLESQCSALKLQRDSTIEEIEKRLKKEEITRGQAEEQFVNLQAKLMQGYDEVVTSYGAQYFERQQAVIANATKLEQGILPKTMTTNISFIENATPTMATILNENKRAQVEKMRKEFVENMCTLMNTAAGTDFDPASMLDKVTKKLTT